MRKRLASLSFSEKIKILEKLRARSLAIAGSGLRRKGIDPHSEDRRSFCTCLSWEPWCGNQPPYHSMLCCLELSDEQIAAAKKRGCYSEEEKP